MNKTFQIIGLAIAWISLALGIIGIVVPLLPTTPFLLLTACLFARCSPRLHGWLKRTRIYQSYVLPFQDNGGISTSKKIRIALISYVTLAVSAYFVHKIHVWIILSGVALFLAWLLLYKIPTVEEKQAKDNNVR